MIDSKMENLEIVKKGYEVNFNKIKEGYLASEQITSAKTRNRAKELLLAEIYYDDWKLKYTGEEITYLNIPIRRRKDYDTVIFEGKEVLRFEVERITNRRKRNAKLDAILNNPEIKYCYIYKRGYYRPNSCGYTDRKLNAGIYTKEKAISDAKMCNELTIIPINIGEHNAMIQKEINELKTRLIES